MQSTSPKADLSTPGSTSTGAEAKDAILSSALFLWAWEIDMKHSVRAKNISVDSYSAAGQ